MLPFCCKRSFQTKLAYMITYMIKTCSTSSRNVVRVAESLEYRPLTSILKIGNTKTSAPRRVSERHSDTPEASEPLGSGLRTTLSCFSKPDFINFRTENLTFCKRAACWNSFAPVQQQFFGERCEGDTSRGQVTRGF